MNKVLRTIALAAVLMSPLARDVGAADQGLLDPELIALYAGTNVNPFDVRGTNNLAMKLVRQGQYTRGLKLLTRAHRLAPERQDIGRNIEQLRLLIVQLENLDMDTAIRYDRSFDTEEVPYIPKPWGLNDSEDNSASSIVDSGTSDGTADVNPFDSQSLITIANVKIGRGEIRSALKDLQRARALSPWLTELDPQIEQLEAQLSELGESEDIVRQFSRTGEPDDYFDNPEPPAAWSMDSYRKPQP